MEFESKAVRGRFWEFELHEAGAHAAEFAADITRGRDDSDGAWAGLAVYYAHVLSHVCRSWHLRHASEAEDELALAGTAYDSAYNRMGVALPRLRAEWKLSDRALAPRTDDRSFLNCKRAAEGLLAAAAPLRALAENSRSASLETRPTEAALAAALIDAITRLCLAWYEGWVAPEGVQGLSPQQRHEIAIMIPPWDEELRLVDPATQIGYFFT